MNPVDALDLILANCCPSDVRPDSVREFVIDGCCVTFTIMAKLIDDEPDNIRYDILSVEVS